MTALQIMGSRDQRDHADQWIIFANIMGTHLIIDETTLSNNELYTIPFSVLPAFGEGSFL